MAKIEVETFGEIAAVLRREIATLKNPRGVSLHEIASAMMTCCSAMATICDLLDEQEDAPLSPERARQVADAIVGSHKAVRI